MLIGLEHEATLLRLEFSRYQIVPHRSPCYSGTYSRCETIETYSPTVDPFPRVRAAHRWQRWRRTRCGRTTSPCRERLPVFGSGVVAALVIEGRPARPSTCRCSRRAALTYSPSRRARGVGAAPVLSQRNAHTDAARARDPGQERRVAPAEGADHERQSRVDHPQQWLRVRTSHSAPKRPHRRG